jgi:hypothetical protein
MFSWYGERSKRGERKGGRLWLNKEIVKQFHATDFLSNILEFTQHLISSIIDLLRR